MACLYQEGVKLEYCFVTKLVGPKHDGHISGWGGGGGGLATGILRYRLAKLNDITGLEIKNKPH